GTHPLRDDPAAPGDRSPLPLSLPAAGGRRRLILSIPVPRDSLARRGTHARSDPDRLPPRTLSHGASDRRPAGLVRGRSAGHHPARRVPRPTTAPPVHEAVRVRLRPAFLGG